MEHNQEYYDKEFTCGNSSITRGELESLPCPFCTDKVSDEQMQQIINATDSFAKQRLGFSKKKRLDFNNDKVSEIWWEELEDAATQMEMPYYENLPETNYN
jgi:hypothetical protein